MLLGLMINNCCLMLIITHINLTSNSRNVTIDTEKQGFFRLRSIVRMKLHFHGADYDRQSLKVKANDHELNGKYRGLDVTIHQHSMSKRHTNKSNELTYRGVHYSRD